MREWKLRSATRANVEYTIKEHSDGTLSCDCPAWLYPKGGRPRGCAHVITIATLHQQAAAQPAAQAPAVTPRRKKSPAIETPAEEPARVFRRLS